MDGQSTEPNNVALLGSGAGRGIARSALASIDRKDSQPHRGIGMLWINHELLLGRVRAWETTPLTHPRRSISVVSRAECTCSDTVAHRKEPLPLSTPRLHPPR